MTRVTVARTPLWFRLSAGALMIGAAVSAVLLARKVSILPPPTSYSGWPGMTAIVASPPLVAGLVAWLAWRLLQRGYRTAATTLLAIVGLAMTSSTAVALGWLP